MEPERFVLDSYAILALLEGAEGHERVEELLRGASRGRCELSMSIVNLGEVLYITERQRGLPKAREVLAYVDELPVKITNVNRAHALGAAHIKAQWPIAYADCFTAALAKLKEATVVTGDPEFRQLEPVIRIDWLGTR